MRFLPLVLVSSLLMIADAATALQPGGSTGTAGAGATGNGTPGAGATGANGNRGGNGGANLLCAAMLGAGFFDNVFTVGPMTAAGTSDPTDAIQFTPIWSASHQATVGQPVASRPRPVAASVKLPITFSAADKEKLAAAGWKLRAVGSQREASYCLENSGQGQFCIRGEP